MQFYSAAEYSETELHFVIEGGIFIAKSKQLIKQGYRALFASNQDDKEKKTANMALPKLAEGAVLPCDRGEVTESLTEPPRHFSHASILQAMTNVAPFVQDDSLKKILKQTDGLGTEATRAGILTLLFQRGFLILQGKQINATQAGIALIDALPQSATYPDMTALWERRLSDIAAKKDAYHPFILALEAQLGAMMQNIKQSSVPASLCQLPKMAPKKKFRKRKY